MWQFLTNFPYDFQGIKDEEGGVKKVPTTTMNRGSD